jgi:transposase
MVQISVSCPSCGEVEKVSKIGKSKLGHQRCRCGNCRKSFQLSYSYEASKPGVKEQILEMSINGSGVMDTKRVLGVGKSTVMQTIKKKRTS